jgi:hypothetical protein
VARAPRGTSACTYHKSVMNSSAMPQYADTIWRLMPTTSSGDCDSGVDHAAKSCTRV